MARSIEYVQYIRSATWCLRSRALIVSRGNRCERCSADGSKNILQVHHLTYERLGYEEDEDLLVLCVPCHKRADAERKREVAERLWWARLNGWASKKYGPNWERYRSSLAVEEEFKEWLDRRGEDYDDGSYEVDYDDGL